MSSIYDQHAPQLMACGAYPLVIGPRTKKPQHFVPSLNKYQDTAGWTHPARRPITSPQPDAGIGIRLGPQPDGIHVIAIDLDDDAVALAALEAFPPTIIKEGKRGFTLFFRALNPIPSQDFRVSGATIVQILSEGRQSVLPPSIHPDLNRPYSWSSQHTLYDTPIYELPTLPDDYLARLESILRPLGYEAEPEKPHVEPEEGNPFQEINTAALSNLGAWVPDLGLLKCRKRSYRYPSYEAVATWRPSNKGRSTEQREPNLRISGSGIVDFGDGNKGYSPIDLVMVAHGCSRTDAIGWLHEHLYRDGPDIDFDALGRKANGAAKEDEPESQTRSEKPEGEEQKDNKDNERPKRFKLTPFWEMRPGVEERPYLIEELIPAEGLVVIWGPPKCFKSFFCLSAMLHVAKGWEFHGRIVHQGAVVYCAFEGGYGFTRRVEALRLYHGLAEDDRAPMPFMCGNANLIDEHKGLIARIKEQLAACKAENPVAVVLDTLNRSLHGSEGKDIDMARYIRAAEVIRAEFNSVVIIVHHCGWDDSRMRGHSSLPAAIDASLMIRREGEMMAAEVEYMKEGSEGTLVKLRSEKIELPQLDINGNSLTSLVLVPADPSDPAPKKSREWPRGLRVLKDAIVEAMLSFGEDHQIPNGPKVRAVDIRKVREVFFRSYVVDSDAENAIDNERAVKRNAYKRALDKAQELKLIAGYSAGGRQIVWLVSPLEGSYAL